MYAVFALVYTVFACVYTKLAEEYAALACHTAVLEPAMLVLACARQRRTPARTRTELYAEFACEYAESVVE